MPRVNQNTSIDIPVGKFLDACTPVELQELQVLLYSKRYQDKIKGFEEEVKPPEENLYEWKCECNHINYVQGSHEIKFSAQFCEKCNHVLNSYRPVLLLDTSHLENFPCLECDNNILHDFRSDRLVYCTHCNKSIV